MLKDFWHLIVPPDNPPKWEDELKTTEEEKKIVEFQTGHSTVGIIIVITLIMGAMLVAAN